MVNREILLTPVEDDPRIPQALSVLRGYCAAYHLSLSDDKLLQAIHHLLYVVQVNEYINLTRITDFEEALILHILDSLVLLPLIDERFDSQLSRLRLLDMGTGAGFPGIPLTIATGAEATLLDSVGKKVSAVNSFIEVLGIQDAAAVHERLESYAKEAAGSFDVVVARAVAPLGMLLEYARPFLRQGGSLLVTKGVPSDEELNTASSVARKLGYVLAEQQELELPDGFGHRSLYRYDVVRLSSIKLPRQIGLAKKNPLA